MQGRPILASVCIGFVAERGFSRILRQNYVVIFDDWRTAGEQQEDAETY
jgi:hypothetical protein